MQQGKASVRLDWVPPVGSGDKHAMSRDSQRFPQEPCLPLTAPQMLDDSVGVDEIERGGREWQRASVTSHDG